MIIGVVLIMSPNIITIVFIVLIILIASYVYHSDGAGMHLVSNSIVIIIIMMVPIGFLCVDHVAVMWWYVVFCNNVVSCGGNVLVTWYTHETTLGALGTVRSSPSTLDQQWVGGFFLL